MQKPRHFSTVGFVLRTFVSGEQDLRIQLLTPQVGAIYVLAKNALKSQRRFQGCLEPPALIDAALTRRGDLLYLEEAALLDGNRDLPHSTGRFVLAGYVLECVVGTASFQEEESPWFRFLEESLRLVRSAPEEILMKKLVIDLSLLALHGLQPQLSSCGVCDDEETRKPLVGLDVRAGWAVCADHMGDDPRVLSPTRGVLKALERLDPPRLELPRSIVLAGRQLGEALQIVGKLIEEHLAIRPQSLRTLGQVLRAERRRARPPRKPRPEPSRGKTARSWAGPTRLPHG